MPRRRVDQDPAEHRADRRGDHGHAEHADRRFRALGHRERPIEHGAADRRHKAGAEALEQAEGDQLIERLGHTAQQRRGDECHERGDEDPPGAEPVAEPARSWDDRRVGQEVADGDPLDVGRRDIEVLGHPWQCDVDHRAVDDRHEEPEDVDGHHLRRVRHRDPTLRDRRGRPRPQRPIWPISAVGSPVHRAWSRSRWSGLRTPGPEPPRFGWGGEICGWLAALELPG